LGYTPEEMIGMSFFHFMNAEARIQAEVNLARVRKGMSRRYDVKFVRKDSGDLWVSLSTSPILDDEGHYEGMLGLVTDITARIRAEDVSRELLEELRLANETMQRQNEKLEIQKREFVRLTQALEMKQTFLETVLKELPAGVVIVAAPSGKLVMGNDRVEGLFGPITAKNINIADYDRRQFFHRDGKPYSPEEWPLLRSLVAGESVNNEEMTFYNHDNKRLLAVNSAPIRNKDGAIVASVAVFSEILPASEPEEEPAALIE
jgi:PAS domain-containing protein